MSHRQQKIQKIIENKSHQNEINRMKKEMKTVPIQEKLITREKKSVKIKKSSKYEDKEMDTDMMSAFKSDTPIIEKKESNYFI